MLTYSKHRRLRDGLRWPYDKPPRTNWRPTIEVLAGLLILIGLHGWMQYRDARDALHEQKGRTQLVAANLANCMNGGAVYDKATDTAHFCGKVYSVRLGPEKLPFLP